MAMVTDEKGNALLDFRVMEEEEMERARLDAPLTHALIVVRHEGKALLMFNKWRQNWELPGGVIEPGETARECAIRELAEETNQACSRLAFQGLMKFELQPSFHGPHRLEYGALFQGELEQLADFEANEEAGAIVLWDGAADIGPMAMIDRKLIELA